MRVSIIVPVLDSHEVFRRQCLHFEKMNLPSDVEIIIVDDGSSPALEYSGPLNLLLVQTHDKRPWTWALARNQGAKLARGEWLIMYDIDHIIRRDLIDMVREYDGQKIQFLREFGVLLDDGTFSQDVNTLLDYGLTEKRYTDRGVKITPHPNMFAMKKDIFWEIGGYREDLVERPYPQGEDRLFKGAWAKWIRDGKGQVHTERPTIYMFPNGKLIGDVDADPKGLFHKLTRATQSNYYYRKQVEKHGHNRHISNP